MRGRSLSMRRGHVSAYLFPLFACTIVQIDRTILVYCVKERDGNQSCQFVKRVYRISRERCKAFLSVSGSFSPNTLEKDLPTERLQTHLRRHLVPQDIKLFRGCSPHLEQERFD